VHGVIRSFRAFLLRSEALTLAIGIVVGVALGNLIDSLVGDVLLPPLGALLAGLDFSELTLRLGTGPSAPQIRYGAFLNQLVSFAFVALVVFLIVRIFFRKELAEDPDTKECPECLEDIAASARRCKWCTSPQPDMGAS
jgi:large conductance mechanosensitive channel